MKKKMVIIGLVGLSLLVLVVVMVGSTIAMNRVPLFESPGFGARVKHYLKTNVAETSETNPYPELRVPVYSMAADELYERALAAVQSCGWEITSSDPQTREINAVITTSLWKFRDDMTIRIEPVDEGAARLMVRSASRVGKGDLGANTRHVLDLLDRL